MLDSSQIQGKIKTVKEENFGTLMHNADRQIIINTPSQMAESRVSKVVSKTFDIQWIKILEGSFLVITFLWDESSFDPEDIQYSVRIYDNESKFTWNSWSYARYLDSVSIEDLMQHVNPVAYDEYKKDLESFLDDDDIITGGRWFADDIEDEVVIPTKLWMQKIIEWYNRVKQK